MTVRIPATLSIVLLSTLALAATLPAEAAEPGWVPLGPDEGQEIRSLAFLPGTPGRVVAAGVSGVFGTGDGNRWEVLNGQGLPLGVSGTLYSTPMPGGSLYLVSGLGGRLFVQPEDAPPPRPGPAGIFRSTDGGASWRRVHEGTGLLAVSGPDPSRLYLATAYGIEESRDGGETWAPAAPDPLESFGDPAGLEIADLEMAPSDPDTIYVLLELPEEHGFPDEIRVLRSRDAGAHWQEVRGPEFHRVAVEGLLVDPRDPDTVYLALSTGVVRSADGGDTWVPRSEGLPFYRTNSGRETVYTLEVLVADPDEPDTLYAATRRFEEAPGGVYRSTDAGATWVAASDGLPLPMTVHDLAFGSGGPRALYAATPSGVFRSTDRGGSWKATPGRLPTPAAAVATDPATPATLFAGTDDGRLFASGDGGQEWLRTAREIPASGLVTVLTIAPTEPSLLFMHSLFIQGIARSTDGGTTWATIESPSSGDVTEILVDPRDPNRVFAVDRLGGVFVSPDQGGTWGQVLEGRIRTLAQAPSDPDVLYAGTRNKSAGYGPAGVCRSGDGGSSWQCSTSGLPDGREVTALAVDPRDSSRVLAALMVGGLSWEPAEAILYGSLDGGATWDRVEPGLPDEGVGPVNDLVFDPRSPETVWAASGRGGVFRSGDGGRSWTAVNRGLTHLGVRDLDLDPSGRVLLAATGAGVARFSTSAGPPPPPEIDWIEDGALSGFRVKARIDQGRGRTIPASREPACIPETLCLSGALPGRSELFVRLVGPKPNGFLWPTLVKFSTSRIEIWIQQISTGELRYYELPGASPGDDRLPGLFDRLGFSPER